MTIGPDGFVEFDDLTELEKKVREVMRDSKRWQRWCRATLRAWSKSPAGLLATHRYKQGNWSNKRR